MKNLVLPDHKYRLCISLNTYLGLFIFIEILFTYVQLYNPFIMTILVLPSWFVTRSKVLKCEGHGIPDDIQRQADIDFLCKKLRYLLWLYSSIAQLIVTWTGVLKCEGHVIPDDIQSQKNIDFLCVKLRYIIMILLPSIFIFVRELCSLIKINTNIPK